MGRLTLTPVVKDGFQLRLEEDEAQSAPESIVIRFTGTADMDATGALDGFLKTLHGEVSRVRLQTVVFDVSALDFMNSSCFKCFVTWIAQVAGVPAETRYEVRFVSQPHLQWQRRSLEALHRFAPDVVTLD